MLLSSAQNDGEPETLQTIMRPGGYCCCGAFSGGHMSRFPHGKPRWRRWEDTEKQKLTRGQPCYWRGAPHQFSPELPEASRSFWLWLSTPSLLWLHGTGWSAALSLAPGGDKAQATAAEGT